MLCDFHRTYKCVLKTYSLNHFNFLTKILEKKIIPNFSLLLCNTYCLIKVLETILEWTHTSARRRVGRRSFANQTRFN